jgi:hypothetical protein
MGVAITLRDQAEHERRGNEQGYSALSRREAKSLPHVIELEMPGFFDHEYLRSFLCVYSCDVAP